jgi:hypothetical protein
VVLDKKKRLRAEIIGEDVFYCETCSAMERREVVMTNARKKGYYLQRQTLAEDKLLQKAI